MQNKISTGFKMKNPSIGKMAKIKVPAYKMNKPTITKGMKNMDMAGMKISAMAKASKK